MNDRKGKGRYKMEKYTANKGSTKGKREGDQKPDYGGVIQGREEEEIRKKRTQEGKKERIT